MDQQSLFEMFSEYEAENGQISPSLENMDDSPKEEGKAEYEPSARSESIDLQPPDITGETDDKDTDKVEEMPANKMSNTDKGWVDFTKYSCPICGKSPGLHGHILDLDPSEDPNRNILPKDDPERYRIQCCGVTVFGISETQVIVNWNTSVLKTKKDKIRA